MLYHAWSSGAARFKMLSIEAFEKWAEARFQGALSQTLGREDGTSGDDDNEALDGANAVDYGARDGDDIEGAIINDSTLSCTAGTDISGMIPDDPLIPGYPLYSRAFTLASTATLNSTITTSHSFSSFQTHNTILPANASTLVHGSKKRALDAMDPSTLNAIASTSGDPIPSAKKPRKTRSDKGITRGPRK